MIKVLLRLDFIALKHTCNMQLVIGSSVSIGAPCKAISTSITQQRADDQNNKIATIKNHSPRGKNTQRASGVELPSSITILSHRKPIHFLNFNVVGTELNNKSDSTQTVMKNQLQVICNKVKLQYVQSARKHDNWKKRPTCLASSLNLSLPTAIPTKLIHSMDLARSILLDLSVACIKIDFRYGMTASQYFLK